MTRDDFFAMPKAELHRIIVIQEKLQRAMADDYDNGRYDDALELVRRINRHAELLDAAQEVYELRFAS